LDRQRPTITVLESVVVASSFGVTLAVSVLVGLLAGQWVDGRLNTGIIFTFIGVFLGLLAGIISALRLYRATVNRREARGQGRTMESGPDVDNDSDGDQ
jgi:F0F1-type ATP synthase assembly protein I